jgi:hypothetical protein
VKHFLYQHADYIHPIHIPHNDNIDHKLAA